MDIPSRVYSMDARRRGMISMLGAGSTVSALPRGYVVEKCIALTVELFVRLAQYQLSTQSHAEVHFNAYIYVCKV
eukprot:scaffold274079_cov49-Attheya_sp.AAC.2